MDFYNDKYECKYIITQSNEDYQKDLLNILNVTGNIDNVENLTKRIIEIGNEINDNDFIELYECCRNSNIFLHDSDDELCLIFLFGYDTLYLMHKLLSSYKKNNKIDSNIKKELIIKLSEI